MISENPWSYPSPPPGLPTVSSRNVKILYFTFRLMIYFELIVFQLSQLPFMKTRIYSVESNCGSYFLFSVHNPVFCQFLLSTYWKETKDLKPDTDIFCLLTSSALCLQCSLFPAQVESVFVNLQKPLGGM